jgi:hypothetical protein
MIIALSICHFKPSQKSFLSDGGDASGFQILRIPAQAYGLKSASALMGISKLRGKNTLRYRDNQTIN